MKIAAIYFSRSSSFSSTSVAVGFKTCLGQDNASSMTIKTLNDFVQLLAKAPERAVHFANWMISYHSLLLLFRQWKTHTHTHGCVWLVRVWSTSMEGYSCGSSQKMLREPPTEIGSKCTLHGWWVDLIQFHMKGKDLGGENSFLWHQDHTWCMKRCLLFKGLPHFLLCRHRAKTPKSAAGLSFSRCSPSVGSLKERIRLKPIQRFSLDHHPPRCGRMFLLRKWWADAPRMKSSNMLIWWFFSKNMTLPIP